MALHCPATLLVIPTPGDEGGVRELADELRDEHLLAVVTAPDDAHGQRLAAVLDTPHESDPDLAGPVSRAVLSGVADLHRGEVVLVLTDPTGDVGDPGATGVERLEIGDD